MATSQRLREKLAKCCPDLSAPLDRTEAERLAGLLKAIADPARLQILSLIKARPEGSACACHLIEPLALSQPTVSHHLKVLHQAGLLERERRGAWVYFSVRDEQLAALRDALE